MKKNVFTLFIAMLSGIAYCQVGINTARPQGVFHVDAAKDNPSTVVTPPTTAQQLNDVIVTSSGNVGVGINAPTEKIDVQGNIRVREPLNGSNVIDFPSAVVMKADGTLGTTKASNVSLQSFQLKIPPHNQFTADFNNHSNTAYDSDNWWVVQKTSFNSSSTAPAKMTIVYEYEGPAFGNASNIFALLTAGNNAGFPDVFVASFISLQTVAGKSRLTVTIARTDHFYNAWAGTFLLNTLLAIKP
ncbi:hypothetical protein SAMN05421594_4079 [Chryseobacterium oleae]|uniref:Uncharacterized protein n=1 Tax=Chryseobacterium oleae TaxID=491207 RepID=A0A1I5BIC9_CHROL|nr:hypothetical protein [Chryseobacterium oleae]SFN74396.1 hypothetical protein SAMN05421594_4079 [Chryseobacterium oleae]